MFTAVSGCGTRSLGETAMPLIESLDAQEIIIAVQTYWIVPAGMIVLYFYGISHFNTPDYRLVILQNTDSAALLTMAPPKYTTTRARFRRYAFRYVLILESAFLVFVFFTAVVSQITHLLFNANLEETGSIQSRAVFALFCLTGLLSSFPGFKDIDSWILTGLHRKALIPDDAKLLASRLFDAEYQPSKKTRDQVRPILRSRDTIRCSEGHLVGSLEHRVLSTLWLHAQLAEKTKESERAYFTSKFEIDLTDVEKSFKRVSVELFAYFREQEKLVPTTVEDIDQYLAEHSDNDDIRSLVLLRQDLLDRCNGLYHRMCLLTSLLVYSTETTAEEIDEFLNTLGFAVHVQDNPIMDWDAVFRVVASVFVLMLGANAIFMGLSLAFGAPGNVVPDRNRLLIFALSTTLLYFIAIFAALKIKRHRRRIDRPQAPPENAMLALYCYLVTLPVSFLLSIYVRYVMGIMPLVSPAPLLFAANQGIVGYFIGVYVDRSLAAKQMSWRLAAAQAAIQFVAALLIFFFAQLSPGANSFQQTAFALFFACQSGLAGFLVGGLFQYFYRRTTPATGQSLGDITVQIQPAAPASAAAGPVTG
jgi:hypothetical protein